MRSIAYKHTYLYLFVYLIGILRMLALKILLTDHLHSLKLNKGEEKKYKTSNFILYKQKILKILVKHNNLNNKKNFKNKCISS